MTQHKLSIETLVAPEEFYDHHIAPHAEEEDLSPLCTELLHTPPHTSDSGEFQPRTAMVGYPGSGNSWIRSECHLDTKDNMVMSP